MLTLIFLQVFLFFPNSIVSDENTFVVTNKRALHVVGDKFLSISIDPAILLTRINLSDISLQMARHLSPAYVRIAGPSTEFVKYIDGDDKSSEFGLDNVIVTPSVWFAINEWFSMANLTPVFGLNDAETVLGVWNPKSILPLLEISDKFNLTCYWQLGYDCSNKTEVEYVENLRILRHILDAFPDKKKSWKIVGSNLRDCSNIQNIRKAIDEVKEIADFVTWEHSENDIQQKKIRDDYIIPTIPHRKNYPKIWTTSTKTNSPVTFQTALQWAKEVGEAAGNGFDVIMRKPRLHEFFVDTPVLWFSLLYKNLIGNIVLDLRKTGVETDIQGFAYCAKNQNNFIHRGAIVLLMVNNENSEHNACIRMGTISKSFEIQSYILTSNSDLRSVYLNGERLKSSMLQQDKLSFSPKLRRAKPMNGVSLSLPPKSIGFFVFPGAKVSQCFEDDDMSHLIEEIREDQELPISEEVAIDFESRIGKGNSFSLKDMQKNLEDELEMDRKFYSEDSERVGKKIDNVLEVLKEEYSKEKMGKLQINDETRKFILDRAKMAEAQKKVDESEQRLLNLGKLFLKKSDLTKNITDTIENKTEMPTRKVVTHKPKYNSLQELLASRPKLDKPNLSSLNKIHIGVDKLKSNHEKSVPSLKPQSNFNDQLRNLFEKSKSKSNHLQKQFESSKNSAFFKKPSDVKLELSSAEIRKILADRVKSRAAKTKIRFTNEELEEIMNRATARLKHNQAIKLRERRGINMRILNEATKHQEAKKNGKTSDESFKLRSAKSKYNPKKVIVSPNQDSAETLDDYDDFYFDESEEIRINKRINEKLKSFFENYSKKTKHSSEKRSGRERDESEFEDYDDGLGDRKKRSADTNCGSEDCKCDELENELINNLTLIIRNMSGNSNFDLKNKFGEYEELSKNLNEITKKLKREIPNCPHYIPLRHELKKLREEHTNEQLNSMNNLKDRKKKSSNAFVNDYHLYQHLLVRNPKKRSVDDNEIGDDSDKNFPHKTNKDDKDFQIIFPNKDKLEYKKNNETSRLTFKHNKIIKMKEHHSKKNVTNIQSIPKKHVDSKFKKAFEHFTSFLGKVGNKIKKYFEDLIR